MLLLGQGLPKRLKMVKSNTYRICQSANIVQNSRNGEMPQLPHKNCRRDGKSNAVGKSMNIGCSMRLCACTADGLAIAIHRLFCSYYMRMALSASEQFGASVLLVQLATCFCRKHLETMGVRKYCLPAPIARRPSVCQVCNAAQPRAEGAVTDLTNCIFVHIVADRRAHLVLDPCVELHGFDAIERLVAHTALYDMG